jgi:hypothetical protein
MYLYVLLFVEGKISEKKCTVKVTTQPIKTEVQSPLASSTDECDLFLIKSWAINFFSGLLLVFSL